MRRGGKLRVAALAYGADVCGFIRAFPVRVVARSAPQLPCAFAPTLALGQLLGLTHRHHIGCISAQQVSGESGFRRLSNLKIGPVLARIEDACRTLQMALFAHAVPCDAGESGRIDDVVA